MAPGNKVLCCEAANFENVGGYGDEGVESSDVQRVDNWATELGQSQRQLFAGESADETVNYPYQYGSRTVGR